MEKGAKEEMSADSLPLLDYLASAQARDEGLAKTAANNSEWLALALIELEQLSRGNHEWSNTEHGFIGEDIRRMIVPRIGKPSSPHCYGALIRMALKAELIFETGKLRAMKDKSSHARRSMVYTFSRGP